MNENEIEDLKAIVKDINKRAITLASDIGYVFACLDKKIEATRDQTSASI